MLRHLFAALLLSAALAARADEGPFTHLPTETKFPQSLHEFKRGKVEDNETTAAGQGVAIHFERSGTYNATLFIYNKALQPVPASVDDPAIAAERDLTTQALLLHARSREPTNISVNARRSFGVSFMVDTAKSKTKVLWDQFIVYVGGRATNDALYIWIAKSHIWKLRLTRVPGSAIPDVNPFVTALVQLSESE